MAKLINKKNLVLEEVVGGATSLRVLIQDEHWWRNQSTHIRALLDIRRVISSVAAETAIADSAEIEENVSFKGAVIICERALVKSGSYIVGPVVIGEDCQIGPNCFINGNTIIGPGTRIGQGAEIKSSVLLEAVALYHFSYIGNSIVGRNVNIAAGVITAVRRFDRKNIFVKLPKRDFDTLQSKVGAIIGDGAQLGVGVLIYPGRTIEPDSRVPPGFIVKKNFLAS